MTPRLALGLAVCLVGLAGCTNTRTGAGSAAPGTAAMQPSFPPAGSGAFPISGDPMNAPAALTVAPNQTASAAGSFATPTAAAAPQTMYNMPDPSPSREVASSAAKPASSSRNSTLSKLASASKAPEPSKPSAAASPAPTKLDVTVASSAAPSAPAASSEKPLPKPSGAKPAAEPAPANDKALIPRPVRKGEGASRAAKPSEEPQSNLTPKYPVPWQKVVPAIMPVSNPTAPEPVDTTIFS